MSRLRQLTDRTFRSLRTRNFRLYFAGQAVSGIGLWMQSVSQMWLVLLLTDSGVALGVTGALQFAPILVAGAWGGVVADRLDKRRLLVVTQLLKGGAALGLAVVTATGVVELWMVYLFAFLHGSVNAVDNPTRRAFVMEMAGEGDVSNAVSLNSALMTTSRIVGPALAGLLIEWIGLAPNFFVNAASFLAVVVALVAMDPDQLHRGERAERAPGQVREGMRYALREPDIRLPLLLMAVVGTLAYNHRVIIPLLAERTFDGGAGTFGFLYSVMSVGSLVGALFTASRESVSARYMVGAALVFGAAILLVSSAPTLAAAAGAFVLAGAAGSSYVSSTQATLQLRATAAMRGRVMALYSVVFLGSTPVGSPVVGWISQVASPRIGFGVGGLATLVGAVVAWQALARRSARERATAPETATPR